MDGLPALIGIVALQTIMVGTGVVLVVLMMAEDGREKRCHSKSGRAGIRPRLRAGSAQGET